MSLDDDANDSVRNNGDHLSTSSSVSNFVDYDSLVSAGTILISVKDSGVGMTEENLQNLFQEGVQFNANQLQGGKGSGLGLWVSKGFAMRHNGNIFAQSDGVDRGSTFTLQLPAYRKRISELNLPTSTLSDPENGGDGGYMPLSTTQSVADSEYLSLSYAARKNMNESPREICASSAFKVGSTRTLIFFDVSTLTCLLCVINYRLSWLLKMQFVIGKFSVDYLLMAVLFARKQRTGKLVLIWLLRT